MNKEWQPLQDYLAIEIRSSTKQYEEVKTVDQAYKVGIDRKINHILRYTMIQDISLYFSRYAYVLASFTYDMFYTHLFFSLYFRAISAPPQTDCRILLERCHNMAQRTS